MKKTDIALIIIIVSISAGLAWWVANATIGKANDAPIIVRTIDGINVDEDSVKVDERVFSSNGINPTVEASISGEDLTSFIDTEETGGDEAQGGDALQDSEAPSSIDGTLPEDSSTQPVSGE